MAKIGRVIGKHFIHKRFHLAIPAGDLDKAIEFYCDVLGCPKGNAEIGNWCDINFWGNELTLHATDPNKKQKGEIHDVDLDNVSVPHFGVHLDAETFKNLKEKLIKKNRCARINYTGDFHMDILPGCIVISGDSKIMVPDRELQNWTSSDPKGYANWFTRKAESVTVSRLNKAIRIFSALYEVKAEQEDLPNEDTYSKEPLKRAVQLTKRYRDIYFEKNPKYKTSSIVLTTIFGELYEGEDSIYLTIDNILSKIVNRYTEYQNLYESRDIYRRIKVLNPVNNDEDFTEKWDNEKEYYVQFIAFVKSYKENWEKLKNGHFGIAEELFGSERIKGILIEQLKQLSKDNQLETAGVTIMSGDTYVDRSGNVNNSSGYRSKQNSNFGDVEA